MADKSDSITFLGTGGARFMVTAWRAKPWQVAERLPQETGIPVIAARDGMKFDLAQLD